MSVVYLISDTHFGHRGVSPRLRPEFETSQQHDETILSNIVSTVKKRDTLWLLGDCFFTKETYIYLLEIVATGATLNYIPGNHDTDNAERVELFQHMVSKGHFTKVGSMFKLKKFWLTHCPIHTNELRGKGNIHGHVHNATVRDENYYNISCENTYYKPVNLQDLIGRPKEVLRDYGDY